MRTEEKRERFIPEEYELIKHKNAVVYLYQKGGSPCAVGFAGKRQKPNFVSEFSNSAERKDEVDKFLRRVLGAEERKKRINSYENPYTIDDILAYHIDAKKVQYFQVVGLVGKKSLLLRGIAECVVKNLVNGTEVYIPMLNAFTTEAQKKRVIDKTGRVRLGHDMFAQKWNGKERLTSNS